MKKPQILELKNLKTGLITVRNFKTKKECDRFLRNNYTTYSWTCI
jgi:hypothetical protein